MSFSHSSESCTICAELERRADSHLATLLRKDRVLSAVALSSEHFLVIPSIGPLTPGHSLVVTRDHVSSILLTCRGPHASAELRLVLSELLAKFRPFFGDSFLIFEHGSTRFDSCLCSTTHAHLHVVPLSKEIISSVALSLPVSTPVTNLEHAREVAATFGDFIFLKPLTLDEQDSPGQVIDARGMISQFLRRRIATALGQRDWNWREAPRPKILKQTIHQGFRVITHETGRIMPSAM
jgi:diadenosine tetraphosphate (Ap4A) HIT family hydrolase